MEGTLESEERSPETAESPQMKTFNRDTTLTVIWVKRRKHHRAAVTWTKETCYYRSTNKPKPPPCGYLFIFFSVVKEVFSEVIVTLTFNLWLQKSKPLICESTAAFVPNLKGFSSGKLI